MIYLKIIQILTLVLLSLGFISQILIPLIKGTKLFPYFSSKRTKLSKEFKNVREENEIHKLEEELQVLKNSNQPKGDKNGIAN